MGTGVLELSRQIRRPGKRPVGLIALIAIVLVLAVVWWTVSGGSSANEAWAPLGVDGSEVEHFGGLASMVAQADLVVLGEVESVSQGREFGSPGDEVYYASISLRVDESIRGRPPREGSVTLEVLLPDLSSLEELESSLPGQRGIYFLRNKGEEARKLGYSQEDIKVEMNFYRFVSSQGLFANDEGAVAVPLWHDEGFPHDFVGRDFQATLRQVRESH